MSDERLQTQPTERAFSLTSTELLVVVGLACDFTREDFEKGLNIGPNGLEADKWRIAEKYQSRTKSDGLHKAIVDVVLRRNVFVEVIIAQFFKRGLIEKGIERFAGDPMERLDVGEQEMLRLMYQGLPRIKIARELALIETDVGKGERAICGKLNVKTTYAVVAHLAFENQRRGLL